MRRSGASIFVYLIFGLLIAIFVIGINPGQQGASGCGTDSNTVITVESAQATRTAYRVAYSNPFNNGRGKQKTFFALDMLVRRELLANAAEARGLRVTGELVDEAIKQGYFFLGGYRISIDDNLFDTHDNKKRIWNLGKFKSWVSSLDVSSLGSYREEQRRSMQAALMAELLGSSVRVSRDEALAEFLYDGTTVTYDLVAFSPAAYGPAMRLTEADVARFLEGHEEEVKTKFKADEVTYKGTQAAFKLREIFIAKAEPPAAAPPAPAPAPTGDKKATDAKAADAKAADAKAADAKVADAKATDAKAAEAKTADAKKPDTKAADAKKPDDKKAGAPARPIGLPIEEAKAKLEAARAAIASGKKQFADAARELSTVEARKANGGDVGWRPVDNAGLGDKAVNDAVKLLKPGEMTPVISTDRGAYLVLVEAERKGDLTYDQVKLEIAADLARDVWSKEAAKRAAIAALDTARAGTGKPLDQLFERDAPAPNVEIQRLLDDPNIDEATKQKLRQMQQGQQGQQGSLVLESEDIPAAWKADKDGSAAPAAPAAPAPAGPAPAVPAAGSAAPAAGSAAPAAPTTTDAPAAPPPTAVGPAPVEASKDVLPAFGDVAKPKVKHHGPTPRLVELPGLAKEVTAVLFDDLGAGMLARRVYDVNGSYVVVQVTAKGEPKVEDFDKNAAREIEQLRVVRSRELVDDFVKGRCETLLAEKKIYASPDYTRETDDKGNVVHSGYQPCMSLR